MTTVNGSVPPVARPDAVGGAEDVGTKGTIFGLGVSYALHKPGTGDESDSTRVRRRPAASDSTATKP